MSNPKGNLSTLKPYQPKWNTGETRTIRVPVALSDELLAIARRLDAGESIEPSRTHSDLTASAERVLNDPQVTRKGKDRGAVRRALNALLEVYQCKPL